jgi:hypothetical protein
MKRLREITAPCAFENAVMPAEVIGPFLPISKDDVDVFNDRLSDEIDSWFASSVCCCDYCYDDFKAHWPDVAFREMEFQTQSSETDSLVEGTRLPDIYSPAEISTLKRLICCPRCFNYDSPILWIYEHRFSDAGDMERSIDELLTLGRNTPFLLLEHSFAQRVLAEIRALSSLVTPSPIQIPLYRARHSDDVNKLSQQPSDLETYGPPPAEFVGEGRFNHAGSTMLYLASSAETAAAELGNPGELCFVGELKLRGPLRLLDLADIDETAPEHELLHALARSALLAAPRTGEGWVKRQYIFSRFVADCARSAKFDAIRYGSIKHLDGANYVLLRPPKDISTIASLTSYRPILCPDPSKRY